jgi:hypothetical protein
VAEDVAVPVEDRVVESLLIPYRKERDQLELMITGLLRQLIPDDHVLVRVERILDLSWLRDEVADLYCLDDGRPDVIPSLPSA